MVFRGNNGEVISIYRHHYSPSPKDEKWIALKGEVAAKRIFSQNLVEARHYYDHFKVIFKPMPQARVMARRKGLDRWNERRDLE